MNSTNKTEERASTSAVYLIIVRVVTILLGLVTTRVLSQFLSVYDYGTYSQIMLLSSTVTSLTILGMVDAANYFFCSSETKEIKEAYISTIFSIQYVISAISGLAIIVCSSFIVRYFRNNDIQRLIVFAALFPVLQNLISILQVLFISIGKARYIAYRNLLISLSRLIVILIATQYINSVLFILVSISILDSIQIAYFSLSLRHAGYNFSLHKASKTLVKRILAYSIPMATFMIMSSLSRDVDKYVISYFSDTETLAVYSNAARILPFDIIMASFCTVLLPYITKYISSQNYKAAEDAYKSFLEISYISTTVLACSALTVSSELMSLLYTEKYISGLSVFCIYIIVDIFRFTNITLVLSASGKTKILMSISCCSLFLNAVLNIVLYKLLGTIGPAISTLIITIVAGIVMLQFSAVEMKTSLGKLFNIKYLLIFTFENILAINVFQVCSRLLEKAGFPNLLSMIVIAGSYILCLTILNIKPLLRAINYIGSIRMSPPHS